MSYATAIVMCLLCAVIGFIGGALVYRNNVKRVEEKVDEVKKRLEEISKALKG